MIRRIVLALALSALQTGCMSTRLELNYKLDTSTNPVYEDYVDYYFWGFVGHPQLNLQKICMDQKPYGLVRFKSPEDGFITLVTLGIYTPSTVQVWCGE